MELNVVAIQRDVNTLSVWQNSLPTTVRAKSFLSPRYIMFYLSTIPFPIHLFTSYSPFLCSKSSYSLLPVIGKKDLSLPPQSWQAETIFILFFFICVGEKTRQSLLTWHSSTTILLVELLIYLQKQAKETLVETVSQNHTGSEQQFTLKSTLRWCLCLKPAITADSGKNLLGF